MLQGERREKTALAESGSLDERTESIQPLDGLGLEEEDDMVAEKSVRPKKSLEMRGGKAREKKCPFKPHLTFHSISCSASLTQQQGCHKVEISVWF